MNVGYLADLALQGDQPGSGAAFRLRKPVATSIGQSDPVQSVQVDGWTTTVSTKSGVVVCYCEEQASIDEIFGLALVHANRGLDYMCGLAYCDAIIDQPQNQSLTWALASQVVTMRVTGIVSAGIGFGSVKARVFDKHGNERLKVSPTPELHDALRFVRMARTSDVLHDAYRNMFLAMESLLHHIHPQMPGVREAVWFKEALMQADPLVPVSQLAPMNETEPIRWAYENLYRDLRSGMMHAKRAYYLPGDDSRRTQVEQAFNAVWRYTNGLMQKILHTPGRGGRLSDYSWNLMCESAFRNAYIAATGDDSRIDTEGGPLSPRDEPLIRLRPGSVVYPEPGVGFADGTCPGHEARAFGPIRRIGTIMDEVHTGAWADLAGDLIVGNTVDQFQIRIGIRNVLVDGVRIHFPM